MEDNKKEQIKAIIVTEFDNYPTHIDLARELESGFIFGKYANSEHYSLTEILDIVLEVEQDKALVDFQNTVGELANAMLEDEAELDAINTPIVIEEVITPKTIRLDLEEQIASEPIVEPEIPFVDDGN